MNNFFVSLAGRKSLKFIKIFEVNQPLVFDDEKVKRQQESCS
jgi:hypothetical protein